MATWTVGTELPPLHRAPTPTSLFAYSAVSWNPHRIHLDVEYTRGLGHADLVVHGTLQADWAVHLVTTVIGPRARLAGLAYRTLAPAYAGRTFTVGGRVARAEGTAVEFAVWVDDATGVRTLDGTVTAAMPG